MDDPKALAVRLFNHLFESKQKFRPSASESPTQSADAERAIMKALAIWPGGVNIPRDPRPRLVKRQQETRH